MNSRQYRGILTINNIVQAVDESPEFVIGELENLIDNPDLDIPDAILDQKTLLKTETLLSYYANTYSYLILLWGKVRVCTDRKETQRVAMRDVLESVASACKFRYEGASRLLTSFQTIKEDSKYVK